MDDWGGTRIRLLIYLSVALICFVYCTVQQILTQDYSTCYSILATKSVIGVLATNIAWLIYVYSGSDKWLRNVSLLLALICAIISSCRLYAICRSNDTPSNIVLCMNSISMCAFLATAVLISISTDGLFETGLSTQPLFIWLPAVAALLAFVPMILKCTLAACKGPGICEPCYSVVILYLSIVLLSFLVVSAANSNKESNEPEPTNVLICSGATLVFTAMNMALAAASVLHPVPPQAFKYKLINMIGIICVAVYATDAARYAARKKVISTLTSSCEY